MAIGSVWSYFAMSDGFVWVLEYAFLQGVIFLFCALLRYWDEWKIGRRAGHSRDGREWYPDWLNFGVITISGIAMINVFAWVGVEGGTSASLALFSWMAILAGDPLGKLVAMYRIGTSRAADVGL